MRRIHSATPRDATFLRRIHSATPRIASLLLPSFDAWYRRSAAQRRHLAATLSFSSHSASPLGSDAVVLLSLSMFFWRFALTFGVMLSPCCRSAGSSRGYAVVLLLCSSGTCMLQLSVAVDSSFSDSYSGMFLGLSTAVGLCGGSVFEAYG